MKTLTLKINLGETGLDAGDAMDTAIRALTTMRSEAYSTDEQPPSKHVVLSNARAKEQNGVSVVGALTVTKSKRSR